MKESKKLVRKLRTYFFLSFLLFSCPPSWAGAPDLMGGITVGILEPTPMAVSVGPTLKIADVFDLSAFVDPFRLVVLGITGGQIMTIGGQARVRAPGMVWAPVVGLGVVRTIARPAFNFMGITVTDALHYVFSFGIEHKISERIVVGADLIFAFRDRGPNEAWAKEDLMVPLGAHLTMFFK